MRILQLCKKFPYPLKDGESIAITCIAKALHELGCSVDLLAMNTHKHWVDTESLPDHFNHYTRMETVGIDNRIKPFDAFRNLFGSQSYHIERFIDSNFATALERLLQQHQYDVVQLETLYLAPYIPVIRKHSSALVAMRAHNVEHEIWERIAANSPPLKRWYLQRITPRLKAYEVAQLNQYDLMVGITRRDVDQFISLGMHIPATVTPIGIDSRAYQPDDSSFHRPLSISFIGSLDWMPNIEGLRWFLYQVWVPLVVPRHPELTFHIAGRNTPAWLKRLQLPRVVVHGEVDQAADFINQHSVMVVPLLSGGGMRAKVLEGMALRKVVLSTPMGMEGIEATHQQECLIATSPSEFADAINWCVAHNDLLAKLGKQGQHFCAQHYDNLETARVLMDVYTTTLGHKPVLA
jgi:glycosyltransferase involved in cell wall biosynthesis